MRPTYALRQARVLVCEDRAGEVSIFYKGKELKHEVHHRQTSQAQIVSAKIRNVDLFGSFGLLALRERVAARNGRLDLESAPGEGTVVAIRLPLRTGAGKERE